jgi:hypothetical protein
MALLILFYFFDSPSMVAIAFVFDGLHTDGRIGISFLFFYGPTE